MNEELENIDELDFEIGETEVPVIPYSWISVFGGCVAFCFVMVIVILSILQYTASRPFDLVRLSEETALAVESFLTNHNISTNAIVAGTPVLLKTSAAHFYEHNYTIQLSKYTKADTLERLLTQKMMRNDMIVDDLIEGGTRQGVTISFGEFIFANVRFIQPSERVNYSALTTAPMSLEKPMAIGSSLSVVSLPRINRAALSSTASDANTAANSNNMDPDRTPPSTSIPKDTKAYTGWVPANKRNDVQDPSTNSADDIKVTRIPSSDVSEPIKEMPRPALNSKSMVKLAIIVDDGGYGGDLTETILGLDTNLTLSILPNTPLGTELAEAAHEKGFEIMLHMPMENSPTGLKYPGQLNVDMSEDEILSKTKDALRQIPYAVGVNNHTGSVYTTDAKAMALFMDMIKDLDLYFVDSNTTPNSRALAISKAFEVPASENDLFLDNDSALSEIRRRFKQAVGMAKANGQAIVICHFRPNTAKVLGDLIASLEFEGVMLVPASELVQ